MRPTTDRTASRVASGIDLAVRAHVLVALYVAAMATYLSLALGGVPDWPAILASFLLVWQVYTYDRYLVHPEDEASSAENLDRVRFVRRHRRAFLALLVVSVGLEALLVAARPALLLGLVPGAVLGTLYMVEVPGLGRRVKAVPYVKSLYVPLVIVTTLLALLQQVPRTPTAWTTVGGLVLLAFLNVVAFDLRDAANDRQAGIQTIANRFEARLVRRGVQAACLAAGALVALAAEAATAAPLALSFWTLAALLQGLPSGDAGSSRFYFGLLDAVVGMPLPLLVLVRLPG